MSLPSGLAGRAGWLLGALALVGLWIARSMTPALDAGVVQDDARQHVFWMQRLVDPSLLQHDLFADYFASQSPPGYVALFRVLVLALDPLTASKLLPPILGLVAATFTYLLVVRLYPARPAAFLATVLASWYVWQYDDLATGSPRAFLLPLTALLLYALVARWHWSRLVGIVGLAATIYPSAAVLGVGIVGARLLSLESWPPRLMLVQRHGVDDGLASAPHPPPPSPARGRRGADAPLPIRHLHYGRVLDRRGWLTAVACGLIVLAVLAPTVLRPSEFGPTVDAQAALDMPEFGPNGRNAFFSPDPYQYWIVSYRSGFDLRVNDRLFPGLPIFFELLLLALLLPAAAVTRRWLPGGPPLAPTAALVAQVMAASLVLFLVAHLLLFRLYLPARFVAWTIPLVLSIAAGVGLTSLLSAVANRLFPERSGPVVAGAVLVLAGGLALYPASFDGNFVADRTPAITAYLRSLPADTLVVGVPTETDSVPAFSGRRVLTNREYALAYHDGYYGQVRERTQAVIDAYYAESPQHLTDLRDRYGVDIFLVNRAAFEPVTVVDAWAGSFEPYTSTVVERVERGRRFALLEAARRCGVLTEGEITVVSASCLTAQR